MFFPFILPTLVFSLSITSYDIQSCTETFVIDSNVTTIGYYAFLNCRSTLINVSFGTNSQLEEIGDYAFDGCTNLAMINLTGCINLKRIGKYAFNYCVNLMIIDLSFCKKLVIIDDCAFKYCRKMKTGDFSSLENLKHIGFYAFYYCSYIIGLALPTNLETLGEGAFSTSSAGANVEINIVHIPKYAFTLCNSLSVIKLGENVQTIGESAFAGSTRIRYIDVPSSVVRIEQDAFFKCEALYTVNFKDDSALEYLGFNAFCLTAMDVLQLPPKLTSFYSQAKNGINIHTSNNFLYKDSNQYFIVDRNGTVCSCISNAREIKIKDPIIVIQDYCFYQNWRLWTVKFPSYVQRIGKNAFYGCTGLRSITIETVNTIGDSAFVACRNLISITITNISSIERYAFHQCDKLKTVILKNCTAGTIGHRAFFENSLENIALPSGFIKIDTFAFAFSTLLKTVVLPNTLEQICANTFMGDTSLTNLIFDGTPNLIYVGKDSFSDTNLSNFVLPPSVSIIEDIGLENWDINESSNFLTNENGLIYSKNHSILFLYKGNANDIELNSNVKIISDNCFYSSTISTIKFPPNLERIGKYAFGFCGNLKFIDINSVNIIDYGAFTYCANVKYINITKVNWINQNTFVGNNAVTDIKIGNKAQNILVSSDKKVVLLYVDSVNSKEVKIEASNIGYQALKNSQNLISVYLKHVETIQEEAFINCRSLKNVYIYKDTNFKELGSDAFKDCYPNLKFYVQDFSTNVVGFLSANGIERSRILLWDKVIKGDETVADENHIRIQYLGISLRPTTGYLLLAYMSAY